MYRLDTVETFFSSKERHCSSPTALYYYRIELVMKQSLENREWRNKMLKNIQILLIWHCVILLPGFGVFARNVSFFLWLTSLLFIALSKMPFKKYHRIANKLSIISMVLIVLCTTTMFSPIDIVFAQKIQGHGLVEVLPIVCSDNGSYASFRRMEKEKKVHNVDYIAYHLHGTILYKPKYAIVIRYTSWPVRRTCWPCP